MTSLANTAMLLEVATLIKRTRKRQIERAKFMDHTGYEWSQWWPKRHGPRQLQVITTLSTRLLGNQRGENDELTAEISGV